MKLALAEGGKLAVASGLASALERRRHARHVVHDRPRWQLVDARKPHPTPLVLVCPMPRTPCPPAYACEQCSARMQPLGDDFTSHESAASPDRTWAACLRFRARSCSPGMWSEREQARKGRSLHQPSPQMLARRWSCTISTCPPRICTPLSSPPPIDIGGAPQTRQAPPISARLSRLLHPSALHVSLHHDAPHTRQAPPVSI